jgi:hypothetical protein
MIDVITVINHYQEDLSWVKDLIHDHVIYCKNENCYGKYDYDLPNYGFDTIAYITYIVNNYDSLPDYCCFAQDNPFDHCGRFLSILNEFPGDREFTPLGRVYRRDRRNILDRIEADMKGVLDYTLPILFVSGAQCIVSRDRILSRSKMFWENIINKYPKNKTITHFNYSLEYLWPQIFNSQQDIEHLV